MINTAEEFNLLCLSNVEEDLARSMQTEASVEIWREILNIYPKRIIDVAQNKTIPPEIMKEIVLVGNEMARSIIAERRKLPGELFLLLSNDPSEIVRRKIAGNKKTPLDILFKLKNDSIENVAAVAEYNLKQCGLKG